MELRVEVVGAEKRTGDREGLRPQIVGVRRCCPSLQSEMVGEPGTTGLNEDGVLAVTSYHLVESLLQESGLDSTCYW